MTSIDIFNFYNDPMRQEEDTMKNFKFVGAAGSNFEIEIEL